MLLLKILCLLYSLFDYIHSLTSMVASNKSNTRSVTCVFSLREKSDTSSAAPPTTSRRASKQTIHQAGRASAPRTPGKIPSREIAPQTANWSLQGEDDTNVKIVFLKMNSGAGVAKVHASHKSADERPQRSEPSSNTLMLPALCSLQGKKGGSSP